MVAEGQVLSFDTNFKLVNVKNNINNNLMMSLNK